MGKSRTSGITKTGSSIGIGGGGSAIVMGGSGNTASFSQPNPNAQPITQLQVDGATPQQVATNIQANKINNANFSDTDDAEFDNYIKQNKVGSNEYLIREVDPIRFTSNNVSYNYTANDVTDMFKTSDINYIGGKVGGQVWGAGTYFGMGDFNHVTGYGSGADGVGHKTMVAVFDKSKAKAIYGMNIRNEWAKFSVTHPKTAKAVGNLSGNTSSIKALLMGYNVITSNSRGSLKGGYDEYYNIIDRSALVIRANNRK